MKDIKNGQMDTITLYVTVGSMLLPKLLQQFRTKFPKTRFNLTQHTNKSISYNFAITSEPLEGNEHIVLLEEEILLGVPISSSAKPFRLRISQGLGEREIHQLNEWQTIAAHNQ